jgi:hypothetical protein
MKLREAKVEFPLESFFYSATGKIKSPIRVTKLKYAEHEDRQNMVSHIENRIVLLSNLENPYQYSFKHLKLKLSFIKKNIEMFRERKEILSMGRDIIESKGGVIYCSETNTTAKCIK